MVEALLIPVIVFIVITVVTRRLNAADRGGRNPGTPSPRVQRLIERLQAQQGVQPATLQGRYTQPTFGPGTQPTFGPGGQQPPAQGYGSPGHAGMPVQNSAQMAGLHDSQYAGPTPYAGAPQQALPFGQPGQFQPPAPWYAPPAQQQRAVQPKVSQRDLDQRVRELMKSGNEVAAVRLLCDEQDLGIIDAQKRARSLVAPAGTSGGEATGAAGRDRESGGSAAVSGAGSEDGPRERYVGSAAFAESIFDTNQDDNESWASGWIDPPEPGDRSDMDELWKTVRDHGRPGLG
jgi:hypothetical protein